MPHDDCAPVLCAEALTKRYGRRTALTMCDVAVPRGRITGLVGPNGAGKSTLLLLAAGFAAPSSGRLRVLGARPAASATQLARVGFVAQDAPVYASLSIADHLRLGARLNPGWDQDLARRRLAQAGLDPRRKAGRLSGGQRAQLALTIAAAKRPELLLLDEPAGALDPLARDEFLRELMAFVAELGASVVLSSHLLGDVERVCDHLIVLCGSRVQVAGDVRDLLAEHHRLVVPDGGPDRLPAGVELVWAEHTGGYHRAIVRTAGAVPLERLTPGTVEPLGIEELVLAYMNRAARRVPDTPAAGTAAADAGGTDTAGEVLR